MSLPAQQVYLVLVFLKKHVIQDTPCNPCYILTYFVEKSNSFL